MQTVQDGAEELRQQLRALDFPPSPENRRALRRQVCNFVDERKSLGWPPERVIVALKGVAHEAGLSASAHASRLDEEISARDELLGDMVRWCIDEYFDPPA